MAQVFPKSANQIARATIAVGGVFLAAVVAFVMFVFPRSTFVTRQHEAREQPVPFYHKHHVGGMGIDCRYCHTAVETSATAGIPPTQTCMNCHSLIFKDSPTLEPVRASWRTGEPIPWVRVHDLPDFVYFNHSAHVNKGVGCTTCHGPIDQMPLVFQASTLLMQWCVDCHRNPAPNLRPMDKVFAMDWQPGADQEELGQQFMKERGIRTAAELTSCSTCHR
jgi:hypothetical protein